MHHRIYHPGPLPLRSELTIIGEEHHHAVRVVRLRTGEAVELFDGKGNAVSGEVIDAGRDGLRVRIAEPAPSRESPLHVTLAMAIIQLEKFELVLQKATELGVVSLIPLVTQRVEVRPERYRGKTERWEKIVFEAVKQSGRSVIPSVEQPSPFDEIVRRPGTKIVFEAEAGDRGGVDSPLTIFIGPEGGWTEEELETARQQQCLFMSLGPRRLRAESAAIAATAIIAARHGDI